MTEKKQAPVKISEQWTVRDMKQFQNFIDSITKVWDLKKPLKIEVKTLSNIRSLPQNALLHVWIAEITKFFNANRAADCVHSYDEPWVKNRLKQQFGERDTFMDPFTGEIKTYLKSTAKYTPGEMYYFMVAIQIYAMEKLDLMLESTGEFKQYQDEGGQIPAETA